MPRQWFEAIARAGMVSKGLVYGLVGTFALLYAVGWYERPKDFKGAIRQLDATPLGMIVLLLLALGLWGYSFWRGTQAAFDPENPERGKLRLMKRVGYLGSCAGHAWLGFFALRKALGLRDDDDDSNEIARGWTRTFLELPLGEILIGLAGAGFVVYGLSQAYYGFQSYIRKKLKTHEMSEAEDQFAVLCARLGFLARAVVFGIIGIFLIRSAFKLDAREAVGIEGTLEVLGERPIGTLPLLAVSIGLLSYGAFMLIQARRRRIKSVTR